MTDAFDDKRLEAMEEMIYGTSNALETLMQIMIDKQMLTEKELFDKMDELAHAQESDDEDSQDADAPADK
jgi:hypothetical protein